MKKPLLVCAIIALNCFGAIFAADAIDRLTAERLESVHQAVIMLKSDRRTLSRPDKLVDVRANLHVHSAFSHDSRGRIDDIVTAAKAAGTQVLLFTEHPADHYDVFHDGHQGLRDGVLLIPGAETKGMLVFPGQSINEFLNTTPQELSEIVRGRDGLTFLSHLEERMDWELRGLTGVEIYNIHADAKDEKRLLASVKNPLWLMQAADLYQRYPQEAFSSLLDYPKDYLKRWDELCQTIPHTGVSANDAHQNIGISAIMADDGKVRVEDPLGELLLTLDAAVFNTIKPIPKDAKTGDTLFRLRLDPYENSLRHVGTHLLLTELSQPAVWQALNSGRAFVAFDWIADSTGFDFAAQSGEIRYEMGSQLKYSQETQLTGRSPLPAKWKLIRNGELVSQSDGRAFESVVKAAGNYRVELWLNLAGEDRIWILSNPIYISEK
jgi:predicted lactoylglutathione lyase